MFKSYLVSALRNSTKNPVFSLINIGGLAIGLAVCILVYLFADRELNFDEWVGDSSHIFRVEMHYNFSSWGEGYMQSMPVPLKAEIANKVPEISQTSFYISNSLTVKRGDTVFYERIPMVDEEFIDIFPLTYIYGVAQGALSNFNSIILSRSLSEKYFGPSNPVGETLTVDGDREMLVTAVYEDIPGESHLELKALIRLDTSEWPWADEWSSNAPSLYVEIPDLSAMPAIESAFTEMIREHRPFMDDDTENPTEKLQLFLQPFKDVHLKSSGRTSANPNGNYTALIGYISIALLILVISCINYINLSTARASKRVKEVCMRKVMGAGRKSLVSQFMGETVLFALIALIISLILVELALPFFTQIVGGELSLNLFSDGGLWLLLFGLVVFMGGVAGAYPALYISNFRPSKFLHSNKSDTGSSARLRNGLVVMQFVVASALIATATIVYSQMNFITSYDIGFEKNNLVVVRNVNSAITQPAILAVADEFRRVPGVVSVARAYNVPTDGRFSSRTAKLVGTSPDEAPSLRIMPSSYDYLETLRVPLLAGRFLNRNFARDSIDAEPENTEVRNEINAILNRSATQKLGIASPEEAIGKTIDMGIGYGFKATYTIVGVVEDFIYDNAANRSVDDMIFFNYAPQLDQMAIRIEDGMSASVMPQIENIWKSFYPDIPIRTQYIEDRFAESVLRQTRQSQLFLASSLIAIFVSSLGLLGLAIFMAERRTKEIGLRKVMGARVRDVVQLLSWQFSKPIVFANVIGLPAAWYFTGQWLEGFSNRIELGVSYFIIAALLTLFIGWATVASHAFKVARKNPITALRWE